MKTKFYWTIFPQVCARYEHLVNIIISNPVDKGEWNNCYLIFKFSTSAAIANFSACVWTNPLATLVCKEKRRLYANILRAVNQWESLNNQ